MRVVDEMCVGINVDTGIKTLLVRFTEELRQFVWSCLRRKQATQLGLVLITIIRYFKECFLPFFVSNRESINQTRLGHQLTNPRGPQATPTLVAG